MDNYFICLGLPAIPILAVSIANALSGLSEKRIFLFYIAPFLGVFATVASEEVAVGALLGAATGAFAAEFATDEDFGTRQYKGGVVIFLLGGATGGLAGAYTGELFPYVGILLAGEIISFAIARAVLWLLSDASTEGLDELDW